jgi:glycosyltransferase involved in cell wall biosynthesis
MPNERDAGLSLIVPAFNEESAIAGVLDEAKRVFDALGTRYEIIVVDDCSTDRTAEFATAAGVDVVRNVQNGGYGYSLMRGIRAARYPNIAIVDGDGSYPIGDVPRLYDEYKRGFAMVVGTRRGPYYASSLTVRALRFAFRALATFIVGRSVPDVNSGMRIFERQAVVPLLPHMSYGFSFTTSITLLFLLQALPVAYVPVDYRKRRGFSKVSYWRDSLKALQIIAAITARLNPIKLFLFGAVVNAALLLPLVLLFAPGGGVWTPAVLVLETSALMVALGMVVEALIDKSPFAKP